MTARTFIRHTVFFSAKDKADIPKIIKGLSVLGDIPSVSNFEVRENSHQDALNDDVDVVVYGEFANADALAAYKAHTYYQDAIDVVRPLRELRIAADF